MSLGFTEFPKCFSFDCTMRGIILSRFKITTMKNISFFKKTLILKTICLSGVLGAQVQLNELTDFGTSIYDINNEGKAVHGNGYYDFMTNTSSPTESDVVQTVAINNAGQVLGMITDESGENYLPAFKDDNVWTAFTNMDENYTYTLYDISENGIYAVGQTSNDQFEAWPFIYNIQTQTLTVLDSPLYEYGAAYGVNNNGIAVGWMDDLPLGTVRMPAYFQEDGTIVLIDEEYGEASDINENNEIVGITQGQPFIYKIAEEELTTYEIPTDYLSASFSDISDNGICVGYAETIIVGEGFLRRPIIYHSALGSQPVMLTDVLEEQGIDASELTGIGYKISPNGNYVGGWSSGPAFMATGWAVYFDDMLLGVSDLGSSDLSVYPNPVKDILSINSDSQILSVSVYNLAGQEMINMTDVTNGVNMTSLTSGVYVLRVTLKEGKVKTFKIIKK